MREERPRETDGRGMMTKEVERVRRKKEERKKSHLREGRESIWKEVGESLTSTSRAQAVKRDKREFKRTKRTRDDRQDYGSRRAHNTEDDMRGKKERGRTKPGQKEAESGNGGRAGVSRLLSKKRSRMREEETRNRINDNQAVIQGNAGSSRQGGRPEEEKDRRENKKRRNKVNTERPKDGRRSLKKWLGGIFARESLAESLSRGHVCRVHRYNFVSFSQNSEFRSNYCLCLFIASNCCPITIA